MKIQFGIITHPRRLEAAEALAGRLRSDGADVLVNNDLYGAGAAGNTIALLERMRLTGADVAFVMQDDVLLCRNFVATVERSLPYLYAAKGLAAASYYVNTKRILPRQDRQRWMRYSITAWGNWLWTLSYALPMPVAQDMVRWYHEQSAIGWPKQAYTGNPPRVCDDITFSAYLSLYNIPAYVTTHSLVQHGDLGLVSLMKHSVNRNSGKGYSLYFIGEDADGLAFDWSKV